MRDKVITLMKAYIEMTPQEKDEFIRELNDYHRKDNYYKRLYENEIRKSFSVGPKNSICACCGR